MVVAVNACELFHLRAGHVYAKFQALFERQDFLMMVAEFVVVEVATQKKGEEEILEVLTDLQDTEILAILAIFVTENLFQEITTEKEAEIYTLPITETDLLIVTGIPTEAEKERETETVDVEEILMATVKDLEKDHDKVNLSPYSNCTRTGQCLQ